MIISHHMKGEHRACDTAFADAEKAVIENDFAKAQDLFVLTFALSQTKIFRPQESP